MCIHLLFLFLFVSKRNNEKIKFRLDINKSILKSAIQKAARRERLFCVILNM